MAVHRIMRRYCLVFVWFCLFALSSHALAQDDSPPLQIGENTVGELTAEASTVQFSVSASGGETANIQVLALSPNFVPSFRVLNPAGFEILTVSNPDGLTSLMGSTSFPDAGDYSIEVRGENDTVGQFVLSLQPGAPLPEPVDLVLDQLVSDTVSSAMPFRVYRFSTTTSNSLILTILSETPGEGTLINLYDEGAGKTIATSDAGLSGIAFRLPAEERHYHIEVRASGNVPEDTAFSVCLGNCGASLLAEATAQSDEVLVNETPEVTALATCNVVSGTGGSINVRGGAGTQFAVVATMASSQTYPVLGQVSGGSWYQVTVNGRAGWVAAQVTRLEGDCAGLPVVAAPANPALAPTLAPTQALAQSSGSGSTTPTATATPTAPPTLSDLTATISDYTVTQTTYGHITYAVTNSGAGSTGSGFAVNVCLDLYCFSQDFDALEPGQSSSRAFSIYFTDDPSTVVQTAMVDVDHLGQVAESNEGNNTATRTAPLPDLIMTITDKYPNADGSYYVSWSVKNIGQQAVTADFWVEVCFDSQCSPTFVNSDLPPGGEYALGQNTTLNNPPAGLFYLISANADVDNVVQESNEGNNSASTYSS